MGWTPSDGSGWRVDRGEVGAWGSGVDRRGYESDRAGDIADFEEGVRNVATCLDVTGLT